MTDFEKPMGFTAVNGRQPSPPRAAPAEQPKEIDAVMGNTNGTTPTSDTKAAAFAAEERPVAAAQTVYRPGSTEQDPPRIDTTNPDRSPSRKRTYPEAFEDTPNQPHPPRSVPRDSNEYRSPEGYQDASSHPQSGGGPIQAGSPYSTDPGLDETDRRTMAALRENSGVSPSREYYDMGDDDEDDDGQQSMGQSMSQVGTPTRTTAAGVVTKDTAKRKRVFSNRTKTGCLTCRKRKKKCDERHPECNNCMRGGFVCEGYTPRASWQKPNPNNQPRAPMNELARLQSKGPGMGPIRQPSMHYPDTPQDYARPEVRPDEHRREMPMPGAPPHPPPHAPEHMRQPYPRPDGRYPNHGLAPRFDPDGRPHEIHNGPPHEPGPSYPPPPSASFPPHQILHHGAPPAPMHPAAPATAVAQAALDQVPSTLPPPSSLVNGDSKHVQPILTRRPGEPSERDKMLQGDYYLPYTRTLMADRDQCAAAVYRFNQACQNPSLGFAHIDRERLFRDIVNLRPTPDTPIAGSPIQQNGINEATTVRPGEVVPAGRIGTGCVVEAPFQCDYGYNLNIGSDVIIGANCRIADTCDVNIGNGVVLSPGVTIMCATYGIDPKERKKGKGRALGRGILIEDDAWIGTNVTILPGVRVGKCSTIGAGSMIHKDVPPYTVVAGNPPKVVRGIGSEEERH